MRRLGRFGERVSRRAHRSALLLAVLLAVIGGLLIAGIAWWLLWLFLGAKAETPNQVDLTKIALTVTAGVGGAVALVVSYRRQRDQERARFAELFGAAAKQLGDPDVAVRIAGVYAMAGVADEFGAPGRRQQCIMCCADICACRMNRRPGPITWYPAPRPPSTTAWRWNGATNSGRTIARSAAPSST
ncbi:hypothetical protein [Nocardia gipuzkoensis]|uniref:hypothetical protein n=1 Tax=Nocardia gipuzkoensis TaxID=2749991 RepID=UPI003EDE964C